MNNPLHSLEGKNIIVTGGTGILGQNFCTKFVEAGARVAVLDRDKAECEKVAKKIGGRSFGVGCDISNEASVEIAVQKISSEMDQLDVLLNGAATKTDNVQSFFESFDEYKLSTWKEVMSVNVDGMFLICQSVNKRFFRNQNSGSIINIGSIYGLVGPDHRIYEGSHYLGGPINTPAVYSASKAAVVGLTKWLSTYFAPNGIRVNCLVPGGVSSGQNGLFQNNYSDKTPMARMAEVDEIVGPAIFLASDASSYITGQVLAADGGWTAW